MNFCQIQIGQDIEGTSSDRLGSSVALSANGNILAVGAEFGDGTAFNSGIIRVYENINNSWIQIGNDINGSQNNGAMGFSMDMSADGTIFVVGALGEDTTLTNPGRVSVYKYENNTWSLLGGVLSGATASEQFGRSVAISADGNIIAVGAMQSDANGDISGQARIYEFQNNTWVQLGGPINGIAQFNRLGASIDLSADGTIFAVGAVGYISDTFGSGQVRIYEYIGSDWNLMGNPIEGQPGVGVEQSGSSLSLSSDGKSIAIGAPGNNVNGNISGRVSVFEYQNDSWQQVGNDMLGIQQDDNFGFSLALNGDASVVAVGAYKSDGNGVNSGQARFFKKENNAWIQIGNEVNGVASEDKFGYSIAISNDGLTVVAGAPDNNENAISSGQVRAFDLTEALSVEKFKKSDIKIFPNPTSNEFSIQLDSSLELYKVDIYNSIGQQVLTSKEKIIDISKLASGMYLVEIETTKGKGSKKLIIE
ncbi:T9SS type A sorting domain-containing protein [Winogradskyella luteola]|uniref:T9SS type A sorting domain-containing protein n=1 Tax=Winogradskyella luteola TaxID=2828330 RepID=A0A9X1FAP6_9FLAO|nr:T9SS type A sorting domain-containing protein [Winogradskyella luteola]MBV7269120.1 T9SS type A sorting domain-containing protein [Winogradskyella luteola]